MDKAVCSQRSYAEKTDNEYAWILKTEKAQPMSIPFPVVNLQQAQINIG